MGITKTQRAWVQQEAYITQALQKPEQEACTIAAQPTALDPRRLSNRRALEVTK